MINKPLIYLFRIITFCLLFIVQSCVFIGIGQDYQGQVRGIPGRAGWQMQAPFGMVLVPGGAFLMGEVGDDIFGQRNPNKRVSISKFFMDDTEITNNEYRQFIEDMLDRVAEAIIGDLSIEFQDVDNEFIMTHLYPDSNVWRSDFAHHMADAWIEHYYDHPAYDDYPVVGISWEAAKYFAVWRTAYLNEYREQKGLPYYPNFSLPSAAQWEYAARGGGQLAKYPWGGPYVRDSKGNLRANFKSGRGNFNEGQDPYTSPVRKYSPNDYGLYDMAGNVAEWTLDAYNPAAVAQIWDLDPVYLNEKQPMKIIKGGSWKDISRFLQTGVNDYEHKDSARSYIGFRCVIPYIGSESDI